MHLVDQLTLEPRTSSRVLGERVAQKLPHLAEDHLIPVIEDCFQKIAPDRAIRIDRLVCDLGTINFRELQNELPKLLAKALEAHFQNDPLEVPSQPIDLVEHGRAIQSSERSQLETFLFILQHGHFPWWFAESEWETFAALESWEDTKLEALAIEILARVSRNESTIIHRLTRHLSLSSIQQICSRQNPTFGKHQEIISSAPQAEQLRLTLALWLSKYLPDQKSAPLLQTPDFQNLSPSSQKIAREFWNTAPSKKQARPPFEYTEEDFHLADSTPLTRSEKTTPTFIANEKPLIPTERKSLSISNAGLILLHPFLAPFFRSMNWLDENQQLAPPSKWHAAQALQFLCRGKCQLAEPTLLLEKILCGIPFGSPAEFPALDASVRAECDHLLGAAIEHWSILKNTTPDGLRDGFLLRPGSLFQRDHQWHLRVERKAIDVLLAHLPWPLQMVKLPWLKTPIHVHWQND